MLIFDASTLILVARIEILDRFLDAIPMKTFIPKEVERECCSVKKTLDALQIQKQWISPGFECWQSRISG